MQPGKGSGVCLVVRQKVTHEHIDVHLSAVLGPGDEGKGNSKVAGHARQDVTYVQNEVQLFRYSEYYGCISAVLGPRSEEKGYGVVAGHEARRRSGDCSV